MPVVVSNSAVTPIKLRWVITPPSLPLAKQTTVLMDLVVTKAQIASQQPKESSEETP